MTGKPLQVLLKWTEDTGTFVIRRNHSCDGFLIEGYQTAETGMSVRPEFSFPFLESEVAAEFEKQGRTWRPECY